MNPQDSPKFWRLLLDYERLTQDESVSIHARDFDAVAAIQAKKPPILEALHKLSRSEGFNLRHPLLVSRIEELIALEQSSAQALQSMIAAAQAERQSIEVASQRLRSLNASYTTHSHEPQTFCAQG